MSFGILKNIVRVKKDVSIVPFRDEHFLEAENLLDDHSKIFSLEDLKLYRQDLLKYMEDTTHLNDKILVAKVDNKVIGLIMLHKTECADNYFEVFWLVIKKGEQNKGYGKELIEKAFEVLHEKGANAVTVETSNEVHNKKTKTFYEKMGFKPIGVLPDYYTPSRLRKRSEDCVIYCKSLN